MKISLVDLSFTNNEVLILFPFIFTSLKLYIHIYIYIQYSSYTQFNIYPIAMKSKLESWNSEPKQTKSQKKMHSKFPVKSHHRVSPPLLINPNHHHQFFCKIVCCAKNSSPQEDKFNFKLLGQSSGDNKWKFNDIDGSK